MKTGTDRSREQPVYVGVTGHRPNRMPADQVGRVKRELVKAMARIEADHPGRRLVLLSGLAEGADRIAAFTALGRHWRLWAILAFHRARFEQDFPEPFARGEFRALLDASTAVEEPKRAAHVGRAPEDGYDAVGQRLLSLSNVLIAIWDGEGSRGRGGTAAVIEQAETRGIPVIWIHARRALPTRHLPASRTGRARKHSPVRLSRSPIV
jgi:hypothetical protein